MIDQNAATRRDAERAERGSAMVVVITLLAALLVAGGSALFLQLQDTRSTGFVTRERQALYCAEAGLAVARDVVSANQPLWDEMLDDEPSNDPPWYPITGDLDDDGEDDFVVRVRDNHDELPPSTNDTTSDNDLKVFVESTCVKYDDSPRRVMELVEFSSGGGHYRNQAGHGPGNTGNTNTASP